MNRAEIDPEAESRIPLFIGSSEQMVPRDGTLLACFQHLRPYAIMAGGFCGRAECATCEVLVEYPRGDQERVLACQTGVVPGMRVVELSAKLRVCLKDLWT